MGVMLLMAVVLVVSVILLDLISGAPILSSVFSDVLDEVEKAEEDIPWVYAAAIIAPITSLTTICIFLLIAAFRGFKNKDIDDLAGAAGEATTAAGRVVSGGS